ncbi:TonB-dependent receptor [Lutibacter sp.]|uniref:TonB-dependent receptor n=1 Tax=Lutibacter sp. TaxID=1925666 RepID=UPI0025BF654D|nr:TonB-dependent receptor [Lutibacter sp.]MCF6181090.1 TonB-dependent receptor [Lutibacter sp.]
MKYYFLILFIGFSTLTQAQNKLTGKITDTKNQPLSGVDIYITELHKGTSTDSNGNYTITNLPNANFVVTAAFIGYQSQNKNIQISTGNNTANFTLKDAVFKMDEVIISTPFNKLQSQNVMKVERASIQQLKNRGAATLIEGITSLPGVSQVSTGVAIGKPVIRGLRGNRVLVYSQGLRLENQQFGAEHGLGVDESSVESVEVIKGPASLLYGSDAMGGVLFFNPLKFAEDNSFKLNINQKYFSNTDGYSTSFGYRKSYESWKFLVNGTHRLQSDYKIPNKMRVTDSRFNETIFNAATNYNNKLISSTLRFNFDHTLVGIPEEIGAQTKQKTHTYPYQDLTNKMISFNNIIFLPNSKITSTFGFTSNDRKEIEAPNTNANTIPALHLKLKTYSYDIKWHLPKLKNFESILGIQGMHQKNKTLGVDVLIPNAQINDIGVFVTGNYTINENSFQGGIRFDNRNLSTKKSIDTEQHVFNAIDKSFKNVTASFGYKTTLFGAVTSRFNFAAGFRSPNLAELTSNGVHEGSNRYEIGNNNLQSEHNFQSDVALEYKSTHFEIFANGFYNGINKYIYIAPTGEMLDNNVVYNYIQNNAELYGGEFGFHIHPHPIDWLHFNSSYETVIGKQSNGTYLPLIPANKLTNTLRIELNEKEWLNNGFAAITYESHFKQNNVSAFETSTNSYNLINVGVGGTIKLKKIDFTINFNVNNLANTSYVSHLSRLKIDGIPNIGRNFITSVKFTL